MREWDPQKGLLYNSVWGAEGGFFFNYFHILTLCSADTLEHDFISPIIFTHLAQAKPWHKIILQMCWPRVHISPFIWVTQTDRESLVMKSCIIAFTQSRSKRRRNQFHFRKFSDWPQLNRMYWSSQISWLRVKLKQSPHQHEVYGLRGWMTFFSYSHQNDSIFQTFKLSAA